MYIIHMVLLFSPKDALICLKTQMMPEDHGYCFPVEAVKGALDLPAVIATLTKSDLFGLTLGMMGVSYQS